MDRKIILGYRIAVAALIWAIILIAMFSDGVILFLFSLKYYTMQTNLMVAIWLILAIFFYKKPDWLKKLSGKLKGAITLYITVTFLVFAIVLSPLYHPTGFKFVSNLVLHYIAPIAFIIDWILTENDVKYNWKYAFYWFIYPICYLCFAIINGLLTSDYLYPFLDINFLGVPIFIVCIIILVGLYVGLGILYIGVNRKWLSKNTKNT